MPSSLIPCPLSELLLLSLSIFLSPEHWRWSVPWSDSSPASAVWGVQWNLAELCAHTHWKGDACLPLCHDGPQETMVGQARPLLCSLKPQSGARLSICPALASGIFPELFLLPPELQLPGPILCLVSIALRAFPAWDSTQSPTSSARDPKFRPYHTPTAFAERPCIP